MLTFPRVKCSCVQSKPIDSKVNILPVFTTSLYHQPLPPAFTMGTCYWFLLPFTTSILDILEVSTISVYTTAVYTTGIYYWCRYHQYILPVQILLVQNLLVQKLPYTIHYRYPLTVQMVIFNIIPVFSMGVYYWFPLVDNTVISYQNIILVYTTMVYTDVLPVYLPPVYYICQMYLLLAHMHQEKPLMPQMLYIESWCYLCDQCSM